MTQISRSLDDYHIGRVPQGGNFAQSPLLMRYSLYLLLGMLVTCSVAAQNPIMFQPGPGLNNGTDEGGLNGGKDTWIYDGDPAMNYGAHEWCYSTPQTTCNSTNVHGLLKFDVAGLPASVDSVILAVDFLDQTNYCYSNCQATFSFNYVDAPWDEMTTTWNSQPPTSDAFAGPFSVAFPEVGGERHYDVTDAYEAWRSGSRANHGFAILPLDGSCNNAAILFAFYSSDDTTVAHEPVRLLVYTNTIGIPEHGAWSTLRISPNPTTNAAFLDVPTAVGPYRIDLLDEVGRIVLQQGITTDQRTAIPLEGLNAGVYFIRVTSDRFGTAMRRLMKQ